MSQNDSTDFRSRLSNWLGTQGYPLEMVVARTFRRDGFRTFQSEYYTDPESNALREIDILAWKQKHVGDILIRLSFCIECKLSQGKPWVIFTSAGAQLADPARVAQRASSHLGTRFLIAISRDSEIQTLRLFSLPERPGYGVTQAFTSGRDVPYAACMAAAKCAVAEALDADRATETQGPVSNIIFPVVVVDGELFECYLDEQGQVSVSEAETGVLVWRNPIVCMPHTIIRISTIDNVPALVQEASEAAMSLFSRKKELDSLLDERDKGPRWDMRIPGT